jgi:hypothetical protein
VSTPTLYCNRHPQEEISLTCGGCRKGICTVCMTLTGEGPRCQDCMARLESGRAAAHVEGVVIAAGEEAARQDSARQYFYASEVETEPKVFCARHPQNETRLTCGRCSTPICPKCMVHSGVGIRCPDCAANPLRTIGVKAEREAALAAGKAPPKDTGFRNYWHKGQAFAKVEPKHYVLAGLASFGVALAIGLVWGFLLRGELFRRGVTSGGSLISPEQLLTGTTIWANSIASALRDSVHLIPEIGLGVLLGEVIARVTKNRVGPGLQIIGGIAFALGILTSVFVVGARIFQNATGQFPPVDALLTNSLNAFGQMFNGNGIGVLLFWAIGIAFVVVRLKR